MQRETLGEFLTTFALFGTMFLMIIGGLLC